MQPYKIEISVPVKFQLVSVSQMYFVVNFMWNKLLYLL